MFKTIQEGLEEYKKELAAYKAWSDPFKQKWGPRFHPMLHCNTGDLYRFHNWNAELKGMEQALGLKEEEVKRINKEIGVEEIQPVSA